MDEKRKADLLELADQHTNAVQNEGNTFRLLISPYTSKVIWNRLISHSWSKLCKETTKFIQTRHVAGLNLSTVPTMQRTNGKTALLTFSFRPSFPLSVSGWDVNRRLGVRGRSIGLSKFFSPNAGSFDPGETGSGVLALKGLVLRCVLSWPLCFMGGKEFLTVSSAVSLSPPNSDT